MKPTLSNLIRILTLCLCAASLTAYAFPTPDAAAKKPAKSKLNKANRAAPIASEAEPEPDIQNSKNIEYKCELGNSLVMYAHANDEQSMAMRWKNRLYKLTRVSTSTGAHRFENEKSGLVWIDIPAKGMLLDSHRGHQLANECKKTQIALSTENKDAQTPVQQ